MPRRTYRPVRRDLKDLGASWRERRAVVRALRAEERRRRNAADGPGAAETAMDIVIDGAFQVLVEVALQGP